MISIDNLLNIILTEAIEKSQPPENSIDYSKKKDEYEKTTNKKVLPIHYKLELIEKKDGSLEWVE